ncbi:hypothetical protein [Paraburkholderia susongensis]|uniref:Uncharacterized protein n=1 Tax=Paraburkholderia susongensis TaxID=1515439 RepID=A0A1X7M5M1_9BURK|nr:hypothetical protein [Paraburkholderia susongensis]SMG61017.1 hypothetical protein SAMN06265784_1198 [Paraburkholderia susongensis]
MTDAHHPEQRLPAFMVGYSLDRTHRIVVGIRAANPNAACAIAHAAFKAGTLWDDTPDRPLLYDDDEEIDGQTVQFDATPVAIWPQAHPSVAASKVRAAAPRLLALVRLIGSRLPHATMTGTWHPETLLMMTLTAGQARKLHALLETLLGC